MSKQPVKQLRSVKPRLRDELNKIRLKDAEAAVERTVRLMQQNGYSTLYAMAVASRWDEYTAAKAAITPPPETDPTNA